MNRKSVKILKEKEKLVMILFVFFFIIGIVLFAFSIYYSLSLIENATAAAPPDLSSLNIIRIAGGIMGGISLFLLLFWANLREKRKRTEVPGTGPGRDEAGGIT